MIRSMDSRISSRWCKVVWLLVLILAIPLSSAPTAAQGDPEGTSYTDAVYGYTVSWDASWTAYATPDVDGYLGLDNGTSYIWIAAEPQWAGDTQACVEGNVAALQAFEGVSQVAPLVINNGAVQGGDDRSTYAAYQYVYTQGSTTVDAVEHLHCQVLVPGQVVLTSTLITSMAAYGVDVHAFNTVVGNMVLPAGSVVNQTDPAAATTGSPAQLDVQAMMLRVDDITNAGLPGFGGAYRQYRGKLLPEDINRLAGAQNISEEALQAQLADAGMKRANVSVFAYADLQRPGSPDFASGTEGYNLTRYIYVYLFEAQDAASAARLYGAVQPVAPMHAAQPVVGTRTWGDQSAITQMTWIEPDDQHLDMMNVLDLTFRSGDLVGKIQLELPEWEAAPTVAQIEQLTGLMFKRIDAVRAGSTPQLGTTILDLEGPGVSPLEQGYVVLDGSFNPIAGATTDDPATAYQNLHTPTHFFTSRQRVSDPSGDRQNAVEYRAAIIVFPDEATAMTYLDARLPESGSPMTERVGPAFGDDTLYLEGQDESGSYWSHNWVRDGNVVFRIQLASTAPIPVETVDQLVEFQMICLDAGTCKSIPVPDAIMQITGP